MACEPEPIPAEHDGYSDVNMLTLAVTSEDGEIQHTQPGTSSTVLATGHKRLI